MQPRKVIFVNRFFWPDHSATSQILTDLAIHLARRGVDVVVVCSSQLYGDPSARLSRFEQTRGVKIHRASTTRFGRGNLLGRMVDYVSFYLCAGWMLFRLTAKGDAIIAKTDPPLLSVVAMIVAKLRGARLINWLQDVFPEVASALGMKVAKGFAGKAIAKVRDQSLRAASWNVVLGDRMADLLIRRGIAEDAVKVIPNWTDDEAIVPVGKSENPLVAEWGLLGKFVVGYSGNLGRAHEFETILGAAAALKGEPGIVFLFIGAGAQLAPVKEAVAERGLSNVRFKPYQPREMLVYSLGVSDLHLVALQPSLEGLIVPSKYYGIAAAGRPVAFIGDPGGEIGSIVGRFDCGASFRVGEVDRLVNYVRRLAGNSAETERLGSNARRSIDTEFSQRVSFAKWDAVLQSL